MARTHKSGNRTSWLVPAEGRSCPSRFSFPCSSPVAVGRLRRPDIRNSRDVPIDRRRGVHADCLFTKGESPRKARRRAPVRHREAMREPSTS